MNAPTQKPPIGAAVRITAEGEYHGLTGEVVEHCKDTPFMSGYSWIALDKPIEKHGRKGKTTIHKLRAHIIALQVIEESEQ